LASSCNNENVAEKEDSNSLNNEKDIIHALQSDDICEDDEFSHYSRDAGGQASVDQSEQQPVTPTILKTQVRPVAPTS